MKKVSQAFLIGVCLLSPALTQDRDPNHNPREPFERFTRELILRQFEAQNSKVDKEAAARREAQFRELRFIEKVNKFVQTWGRFVSVYNERKAFDVKTAKELSKAFHELESSGDWPRLDRK